MKPYLTLLVGISGSGKTTIGKALEKYANVRYVWATEAKLALLRPGEELNFLDQKRSYEVNAKFLRGLPSDEDIIVDTHATYPFGDGFVRLTPPQECTLISGIVLLEATNRIIRTRRLKRGRLHEATGVRSIEQEARAEREEVARLSRTYRIPVCALDTTHLPLEKGVSIVRGFVQNSVA